MHKSLKLLEKYRELFKSIYKLPYNSEKKPWCLYFSNALICVSKSIGLVKRWKEIYVNSLQKVFTETRLSKTQLCKPRVSELRKQQYNVTRLQSFSHVVVLWQMQKFVCYCTVFALFYFEFDSNFQVQAPRGIYLEGRFNGRSLKLRAWGAYIQKGLYMEGHIFGILRFL